MKVTYQNQTKALQENHRPISFINIDAEPEQNLTNQTQQYKKVTYQEKVIYTRNAGFDI